jgi:acetoacetyl-CoA synthetase
MNGAAQAGPRGPAAAAHLPARLRTGDTARSGEGRGALHLNYAECLLFGRGAGPEAVAITACHADGRRLSLTRAELHERVAQMAEGLREQGVGVGDRVVAILRNDADAAVTALAVAAIGASLCIADPGMSAPAIVERFEALAPSLLVAHAAASLVPVASALASLHLVLTLDDTPLRPAHGLPVRPLSALIAGHHGAEFHWQRFAFEQTLIAAAAPGSTEQSAGDVLTRHVREQRFECGLHAGDMLFFPASCASATWRWQLSALASGCTIMLYDGPVDDTDALQRIAHRERVTLFGGTSAEPVRAVARVHLQREGAALE